MSIWPSIQHLEVVSWETPTNQTTKPPSGRWAPYEVRWLDESDSAETTLPRLLRPGSLRVLQLMKTPSDTFFEALMKTHGPYLRSLRLRQIPDNLASSLAECEALEEFKYLGIPSADILAALPASTMQHLSLQNGTTKSNSESIKTVIEWIESKALGLRAVTYNSCGSPEEREFRRLVEVCRARDIDLQCFADTPPVREVRPFFCVTVPFLPDANLPLANRFFFVIQSEPLVRPDHFPRPTVLASTRRPVSLTVPVKSLPAKPSPASRPAYPPGARPHRSYASRSSSDIPVVDVSNSVRMRKQKKRAGNPEGMFGIKLGL